METDELHNLWKNIDSGIQLHSSGELKQLLEAKTRYTINKFLYIIVADIVVCLGLIVFLFVTALHRQSDLIYLTNNFILGLITVFSLITSLYSWNKLQNKQVNLPLKDWLQQRIKILSSWLLGKYSRLYVLVIPILLIMINLSVHVYYERKLFVDVLNDEESIYGLIFGFLIGLIVAYYAVNRIRKYQLKNLEFLKDLYSRLCSMG